MDTTLSKCLWHSQGSLFIFNDFGAFRSKTSCSPGVWCQPVRFWRSDVTQVSKLWWAPISYASRSINLAEKNYSQMRKEPLAIICGISKFYMYLYGRKFAPWTTIEDCSARFCNSCSCSNPSTAWILVHSSNNYDIKFKKSKDMDNADALSRLPLPYTTYNSVKKHLFYTADLDREAARDKTLASIKMVGFKDLEKISTFNLKRLSP